MADLHLACRGALSLGDRLLLVYSSSFHFSLAFVARLRAGLVAVHVYPPDPRKLRKGIQVCWCWLWLL